MGEASTPAGFGQVVLVHDYLNQPGGAERVLLEMARIWPEAPIYTSLYRPESTFEAFRDRDIRTSWLDRLGVDRNFRALFPLYPAAFRSFGALDGDLVLSSSSGWAHSVRTSPRSFHVVYCHSPARWLWADYVRRRTLRRLVAPVASGLRRWDVAMASRPELYIANSIEIKGRVKQAYGREASVVYPPVDTERFTPRPRGDRLLTVSRVLAHKRLDLIVRACTSMGIGLDIVGTGPALTELKGIAGPTVTFHGRLSDAAITELFENCRAYCLPGREDFGIAPVEAQAAGKPVIAFAQGGALETVADGVSGILFARQDEAAVKDAITRCESLDTSPEEIAEHARRFSVQNFRRRLVAVLAAAIADR